MHRGMLYPYATDRWVVPTFFWPGFLPDGIIFEHSALPPEWLILNVFDELVWPVQLDPDRQTAFYQFYTAGPDGGFAARLHCFDASITPGVREPAYSLRLWNYISPVDFDLRAYALSGLTHTGPSPFPYGWTYAVDFTTGAPIPPPGSVPRPAVWAEIP